MIIKVLIIGFLIVQNASCMETECTDIEKQTLQELADVAAEINSATLIKAAQNLNNLRVQKKSLAKEQGVRLIDKALFGLVLRWHTENDMALRIVTMLCDAGADPLAEFNIRERMNISVGNEHYSTTEHSYVSTAKEEAKGSLKQYLDSLASR